MTGHVIDDHVRHDVHAFGKGRDVVPRSQARIHLGVIDGVEAGIGAVDWMEERQHVDAPERARQRPVEQALKIVERAAGQPIDVRDELRLILHQSGIAPGTLATIAPARFEKLGHFRRRPARDEPVDECRGERVAGADGVGHGDGNTGRLDVVVAHEHRAAACAERHTRRLPAKASGAGAAESLGGRRQSQPVTYQCQFAFVQFYDVGEAQQVAREFARLEAGPQVDVIETAGARQRVEQPLQHLPAVRAGREECSVVAPRRLPLHDLREDGVRDLDGVVRGRPFDHKRRAVARTKLDRRRSGVEPVGPLQERRIQPERCDRGVGGVAQCVPPHGAHDPRDVAQPFEVNGEVQRRAAKPGGVGKHVPQHFADDQRVGTNDVPCRRILYRQILRDDVFQSSRAGR